MASKSTTVASFEAPIDVVEMLKSRGYRMTKPDEAAGNHTVTWAGRSITLPAEPTPMSVKDAAKALAQKAEEEEMKVTVAEAVDTLPWDGAQAFAKAIDDLFGWRIMRERNVGFFKIPPTIRSIKTGPDPDETIQVFWGDIHIPNIDETLRTSVERKDGRLIFQVSGEIRKKNRHILEMLMALTRIYAQDKSIYKGKAFSIEIDDSGKMTEKEPVFLKLNPHMEDELIFSQAVKDQLDINLFMPIKHTQTARQLGVPLKRGILLEGPYGVGKTMAAAATASIAVRSGWTYITINRVSGLHQVLEFARRYAPCVIFAEDIDRVISGEERTVKIDDILNTLDGVSGKTHEVITVLTSNHVDRVNKAMLRPGRLDAIITITPPDEEAAEKLMRSYSRGLIKPSAKLTKSREAVAGRIPAVIREVVERAKLAAVLRCNGAIPTELTDEDLVKSANSMAAHLELMRKPEQEAATAHEQLGRALADVLEGVLYKRDTNFLDPTKSMVSDIQDTVNDLN